MKTARKISSLILTVVLVMSVLIMPSFAAPSYEDGLEVSLTTDKDVYSKGEEITATFTVKNTTDEALSNVSLQTFIPKEYELAKDSKTKVVLNHLESGEMTTLVTTLVPVKGNVEKPEDTTKPEVTTKPEDTIFPEDTTEAPKDETPNTGAASTVAIWTVLAIALAIALLIPASVKNKKLKRFLAFALCFSILAISVGGAPVIAKALENNKEVVYVDKTVKVDNKDVTIRGMVKYDGYPDEDLEKTYTRGEWIELLIDKCGLTRELIDKDTPSYTDIEGEDCETAVELALSYGMLDTESTEFRPNDIADRDFVAATAVRCLGYQLEEDIFCEDAAEIEHPKEAAIAVSIGLFKIEDNMFSPATPINRIDVFRIFHIMGEIFDSTEFDDEEHKGIVYLENVELLPEDIEYINDEEKKTVTLTATEELKALVPGEIIAVKNKDAFKVASIKVEGDKIEFVYSEPEAYEVFDEIDIQEKCYADFSKIEPAEGVIIEGNGSEGTITLQNNAQTYGFMDGDLDVPPIDADTNISVNFKGDTDLGKGYKFKYSLKQSIDNISAKVHIDFNVPILGRRPVDVKNLYLKLEENTEIAIEVIQEGEDAFLEEMVGKPIRLGNIPIYGIDNLLGVTCEIDLIFAASGEAEIVFNLKGTLGVQVYNNEFRNITRLTPNLTGGAKSEISIGPRIGLVAEVANMDLISFKVSGGGRINGEIMIRDTGMVCMDATVSAYLEFTAFEDTKINEWLKWDIKWEIWNKDNSPIKESIHIEDLKIVPECTWKSGTVTGKIVDAQTKAPISSNAIIKVLPSTEGEEIKRVRTNENGEYEFKLDEGDYIFEFSAPGYKSFKSMEKVKANETIYIETALMVENSDPNAKGVVGGLVTDSLTDARIGGAKIKIRNDRNNVAGVVIKEITSDSNGSYKVELPIGMYTFEVSKPGYDTNSINVIVTKGETLDFHCVLDPNEESSVPTGDIRVILEWGQYPYDLDSHLVGPDGEGGKFHIYYRHDSFGSLDNGKPVSYLDNDDVNSYGPETITVYKKSDGIYHYCVQDFTNRNSSSSTSLANSGAKVTVKIDNKVVRTFYVPTNKDGTVWHVFDYDSVNNRIIPKNEMYYESDPDYVGM